MITTYDPHSGAKIFIPEPQDELTEKLGTDMAQLRRALEDMTYMVDTLVDRVKELESAQAPVETLPEEEQTPEPETPAEEETSPEEAGEEEEEEK